MHHESFKSNWRSILIIVTTFIFCGVWLFNVPSGPAREDSGEVVTAAMDASSKYRLPQMVVNVRLNNGETVSAKVLPNVAVLAGDRVKVRVYERVLTKAPVYEVYVKITE